MQLLRDIGAPIIAVQLVPVPAGARDAAACAWSATTPTPSRWPSTSPASDQVESVHYAGLPDSAVARPGARSTAGGRGFGSVPAFIIKGGQEAGQAVRRGARAAQPRRQHRRRAQPRRSTRRTTTHTQLSRGAAGRPASTPAWSACRSASRRSTTSSPTSTRASRPRSAEHMPDTFPALRAVVLDATDARAVAEFYRELLGYAYRPGDEAPPPGQPDPHGEDWLVLGSAPARRASPSSRSPSCRPRRGRTRRCRSSCTST